jgi:cell filamentation protein
MKYDYGNVEYEGEDFYCYPGTKVLMNRFNIQDGEKLQQIERDISYAKILYLGSNPLKGTLNLKYLQRIHKYIFEDIYTWAGRIRGGQFFFKGDTEFCRADRIHDYADNVFSRLKSENWLRRLERKAFIERLAFYMGEINALHPFREGNGRAQRIFFAELTRRAKYELDFGKADAEALLQADIAAYNKDYVPLMCLLDEKLLIGN